MADVVKNPYTFTSADAGATDQISTLGTGGRLKVRGIRWVGATTAGHQAIIQDNSSRTIWASVADAANFLDESDIVFWLKDGLRVTTLGSGTLYVYIAEGPNS